MCGQQRNVVTIKPSEDVSRLTVYMLLTTEKKAQMEDRLQNEVGVTLTER